MEKFFHITLSLNVLTLLPSLHGICMLFENSYQAGPGDSRTYSVEQWTDQKNPAQVLGLGLLNKSGH